MKGDKLLFQKHHKLKARRIVSRLLSHYYRAGAKYVIALGGESGTGKTEITYYLRELLYDVGIRVQMISLDDYYRIKWSIRNKVREENQAKDVGSLEIDWELLDRAIDVFKSNESENVFRQLNKYIDDYEYTFFDDNSVDILIVEGLYALDLATADLRIYLEGGYKETRCFRLERGKEVQSALRNKILDKEREAVIGTYDKADFRLTFDGLVI